MLLRHIPDGMLVKAFNNIFFKHLLSLTRPAGAADRSCLPIQVKTVLRDFHVDGALQEDLTHSE